MTTSPSPRLPERLVWTRFPYTLVRIPGIPRSRLVEYRYHDALALNERVRHERTRLLESGERLQPSLHELVPRVQDLRLRHDVLAARRALFNVRALPAGVWLEEVRRIEPRVARELVGWSAHHQRLGDLLRARDSGFDEDAARCTARLLIVFRELDLRLGLSLANPSLARQLAGIQEGTTLDKRQRQAIGRGMRYLLRAVLKPTPLGFFAGTAVVSDPPRPAPSLAPSLTGRTSRMQSNRAIFQDVARALFSLPAVRERATAVVSPALFEEDGRCWMPSATDSDGPFREVPLDPGVVQRLLGVPREGVPYSELAEHVRLSDEQIELLRREGIVELEWGASEGTTDDDLEVLIRLLWEAAPADISLLSVISSLRGCQVAIERATTLDPDVRLHALLELEKLAAALPGAEPGARRRPVLFEDTACPVAPSIAQREWEPFLAEVVHYGAGLLYPRLLPSEQVLLHLFRLWNPGEIRVPILRFHRQYLAYCRTHDLGVDHFANTPHLSRILGLPQGDPTGDIRADLERIFAEADHRGATYLPDPSRFDGWDAARSTRLSVRFAPAQPGPAGSRFCLVFWGGDRMSLFPRYASLPCPGVTEMSSAFRGWMARWPGVADVYAAFGRNVDIREAFTCRTIDIPGGRPTRDGIALRDLDVTSESTEGRLRLIDRSGAVVTPIFFGVSGSANLPPLVQFLQHLSGYRTSFLELLTSALNQLILGRFRGPIRIPVALPALYLGNRILLSPAAFIVHQASLPHASLPVDRTRFFAFHDWLDAQGMPHLAQVRVGGRDPLWIDFDHPEGVGSFLRLMRRSPLALVSAPAGGPRLISPEGTYEVEYAIEIAAGTQQRPVLVG